MKFLKTEYTACLTNDFNDLAAALPALWVPAFIIIRGTFSLVLKILSSSLKSEFTLYIILFQCLKSDPSYASFFAEKIRVTFRETLKSVFLNFLLLMFEFLWDRLVFAIFIWVHQKMEITTLLQFAEVGKGMLQLYYSGRLLCVVEPRLIRDLQKSNRSFSNCASCRADHSPLRNIISDTTGCVMHKVGCEFLAHEKFRLWVVFHSLWLPAFLTPVFCGFQWTFFYIITFARPWCVDQCASFRDWTILRLHVVRLFFHFFCLCVARRLRKSDRYSTPSNVGNPMLSPNKTILRSLIVSLVLLSWKARSSTPA